MLDPNSTGEVLTPSEVAKDWRVSLRTVQRYIRTGRLKAFRLPGGHSRIRRHDAEAALGRDHEEREAS